MFDIKEVRLHRLSFDTALKVDRRVFKKAIVNICKAVPKSDSVALVTAKGSTNMAILAYQNAHYRTEDGNKAMFYACAKICDVENAETMDFYVDGKTINSCLKSIRCDGHQKVRIKQDENGLHFCFGDDSDALRKSINFVSGDGSLILRDLFKIEYVDSFQIDDLSYYFKETMHACESHPDRNFFYMGIDAEKHILVTTPETASFRGFITGEIKYTLHFYKQEAKRIAALFLGKTVTIRIPKQSDFLLITDGKFAVYMSLPKVWGARIEYHVTLVENEARKKVLTITAPREKLIKECESKASSPYIQLTISGKVLKIGEYGQTSETPTEFSIEKNPRDKNISCAVNAECLCDALRSITSPSISIRFSPRALFITDHYLSTRRLPHSLRALEIVYMIRDSFHIL